MTLKSGLKINLMRSDLPLLRGWAAARYYEMARYLNQRAAGEVNRRRQSMSDLPGRAGNKVAMHLLDRRVGPSSKEGRVDSRPVNRNHL